MFGYWTVFAAFWFGVMTACLMMRIVRKKTIHPKDLEEPISNLKEALNCLLKMCRGL